ncbi:MAG: prepilin-type N-terminal cleavage/methylation domain-containing protein [Synergistaceae bacterium]|nr:prepilin-type N-terminal cleavage/methylation domain-containing protein [Synergistaceae bacterium]
MKLKFNRDGFSLVELLVVIVLIAILSGVYSILSVQAVNSAEASRIINNLYSLKNAVLLWRRDNSDCIDNDGNIKLNETDTAASIQNKIEVLADIAKYIDGGNNFIIKTKDGKLSEGGEYGIVSVSKDKKTSWCVGYHLTFAERYNGLREVIRTKGKSMNVWVAGNTPDYFPPVGNKEEKGVWLKVFGDWEPTLNY